MENWTADSVLQHHGILGMKWGIRRFQPYPKGHVGGKEVGEAAKAGKSNDSSSSNTSSKKRFLEGFKKSDSNEKKEKETPEELTKDKKDELKRNIINTGDLKSAYAHRDMFTTNELQDVINRYEKEKRMKDLITPKTVSGYDKLKKFSDYLGTAANLSNNGINAYNNIAKISNTFMGTKLKEIKNGNDKNDNDSLTEKLKKTFSDEAKRMSEAAKKTFSDESKKMSDATKKSSESNQNTKQKSTNSSDSWSSAKTAGEAFRKAAYEHGATKEQAERAAQMGTEKWNDWMSKQFSSSTNSSSYDAGKSYTQNLLRLEKFR